MMFGRFPRSPSTTTPYLHIIIIIIIIVIVIIASTVVQYSEFTVHSGASRVL